MGGKADNYNISEVLIHFLLDNFDKNDKKLRNHEF